MRTKKIYFFLLALSIMEIRTEIAKSQNDQNSIRWDVKELSITKWNTSDGIPYLKVPGANLGATSFEVCDEDKIAFLCNSTSEIFISDLKNGSFLKKFPVQLAPRDFVHDNGLFYVLLENNVTVYDKTGKEVNRFAFPNLFQGAERLTRYNNSTYLLLPSGNSLKIETDGTSIEPMEQGGWITSTGQSILTKLKGNDSYSIIFSSENQTEEKTFTTDKKVAGVYVVGATKNRIVLDVQKFISENPIVVERNIVSVEIKNGLGDIIASLRVPDCYYVLSNKDFSITPNGTVFNMMTTPQGTFIFSLEETSSENAQGFPASLMKLNYHFNNHLLPIDKR